MMLFNPHHASVDGACIVCRQKTQVNHLTSICVQCSLVVTIPNEVKEKLDRLHRYLDELDHGVTHTASYKRRMGDAQNAISTWREEYSRTAAEWKEHPSL